MSAVLQSITLIFLIRKKSNARKTDSEISFDENFHKLICDSNKGDAQKMSYCKDELKEVRTNYSNSSYLNQQKSRSNI